MKLTTTLCIAVLSFGPVACGDNAADPDAPDQNTALESNAAPVNDSAADERETPATEESTAADQDVTTERPRLPSTSSPLALIGVLGLASIAGAAGLRMLRR